MRKRVQFMNASVQIYLLCSCLYTMSYLIRGSHDHILSHSANDDDFQTPNILL